MVLSCRFSGLVAVQQTPNATLKAMEKYKRRRSSLMGKSDTGYLPTLVCLDIPRNQLLNAEEGAAYDLVLQCGCMALSVIVFFSALLRA